MTEKKSFALRIDSETMKAIEKWAADEFRSVNGQIEWMLNNSLKEAKRIKGKTVVKKQCPNVIVKKRALSYGIFVGGKSVQRGIEMIQ